MKRSHRILLTAAFAAGGGLVGLLYYQFFGCRTGCPITSSPVNTMVYTAVIGLLLSGVFLPGRSK